MHSIVALTFTFSHLVIQQTLLSKVTYNTHFTFTLMAHCTSGAIRGSVSCSRTLRQGIELATFWLLNDFSTSCTTVAPIYCIEVHPWSEAISRSFRTLTKATSVLWWALKPDWKSSSILFLCRKRSKLLSYYFFKDFFYKKGRLDLGL